MFTIIFNIFSMMVKSPYDTNGPFTVGEGDRLCCVSCGYTWCETLSECVRVWETYCESLENGH